MPEQLIPEARDLVARILEDDPQRLRHCAGVAARAQALAATVPLPAADTLVASAWLHDIGYGSPLRDSGFHPLDGAVYLRREGWPAPVCDLVAHHSGSRFVARIRALDDRLSEFNFVEDALSDALTVADNTAGPDGTVMTVRNGYRTSSSDTDPTRRTPSRLRARRLHSRHCPARGRSPAVVGQRDPALEPVGEQRADHR